MNVDILTQDFAEKIISRDILHNEKDYKERENYLWWLGDKYLLQKFYKQNMSRDRGLFTYCFYNYVNNNNLYKLPVMHYALPNIITKAMTNLIFSEKPTIMVETGNKTKNKSINDKLEYILDNNNYFKLLTDGSDFASYSGSTAFKIIVDSDYADYPIIMVYPKERFDIVKKYNDVVEVIFKDYYTKDNNDYVLLSEYGRGFINYKLYKANDNSKEVPLSTLEETKDLKKVVIKDADGKDSKTMLAVYLENKPGAKSDYDGCIDSFQAVDEAYSNFVNYLRKSKIKTYVPEKLCEKDQDGNILLPDDYESDNVILYDGTTVQDSNEKVERDIVDIQNSCNGYKTSFDTVIANCLQTTGLDKATLGLDPSGANASGEALSIREKNSMRTRSQKIHQWDYALKTLSKTLLKIKDMQVTGSLITIDNSYDSYEYLVTFAEYEAPTFDAVVSSLAAALDARLIDLPTALNKLWSDELSETQIKEMLINIDSQISKTADMIDNELIDTETIEEKSEQE